MATKKQMFDEVLSDLGYSWDVVEKMTKREVEDLFNKLGSKQTEEKIDEYEDDSIDKSLQDELSKFSESPILEREIEQEPKQKKSKNKKSRFAKKTVISGYMMLMIIDLIIPNIIVFAYSKLKGKNIPVSEMQLTLEQKEELQPLADEAAKTLSLEINPMYLFLLSLGTYYAANFFALSGGFEFNRRTK